MPGKISEEGCLEHFVSVNSFQALANYGFYGLGAVHGTDDKNHPRFMTHTVTVPKKGVVRKPLRIVFPRRDMSLNEAVGLACDLGFRSAVLPEVDSVFESMQSDRVQEALRAMRIAAHGRGKNASLSALSVICTGTKVGTLTPVRLIALRAEGVNRHLLLRDIDHEKVMPHSCGLALVHD